MDALKVLEQALDDAQNELGQAEVALLQATARAEAARNEQAKLAAAVAALNGEPPTSAVPSEVAVEQITKNTQIGVEDTQMDHSNGPPHAGRTEIAEMTPEEFEAHRKRNQRKKRLEDQANNPYAHIKCSGCGQAGSMNEAIIQAPSGAPVRMLTCSSCGNQVIT